MERIPTGISRLDSIIGGGAPAGSVVLLAGEVGAGARAFMHTSAAINGLLQVDDEQFDLHYGDLHDAATPPDDIHYLSFTDDERALVSEMSFVMVEELVDAGVDPIHFVDLSDEYFEASQVPTDWYATRTENITQLGERHEREDILSAVGDYLTANATGGLVCVDSVTDLLAAASDNMEWSDVVLLLKGLEKAANKWGSLVFLLANVESVSDRQLGTMMDAADGTLLFEWESGGSERARTLIVKQFRGVLSRLEAENIVRFETEIHDGGFDISNVRKIR